VLPLLDGLNRRDFYIKVASEDDIPQLMPGRYTRGITYHLSTNKCSVYLEYNYLRYFDDEAKQIELRQVIAHEMVHVYFLVNGKEEGQDINYEELVHGEEFMSKCLEISQKLNIQFTNVGPQFESYNVSPHKVSPLKSLNIDSSSNKEEINEHLLLYKNKQLKRNIAINKENVNKKLKL